MRWIKIPLGTEVGLGPCDIVLDGTQLPLPKRGEAAPHSSFHVLWPNGWMDQDATCILVTRFCVFVCLSVCPSPHSYTSAWTRM